MLLYILISIFIALLQSTIISYDLFSLAMLLVMFNQKPRQSWIIIFICSIIFDLISGRMLGTTSMLYLTAGLFLWLYRKKYNPYHGLFVFLFSSITVLVVNWLYYHQLVWVQSVIAGLIFIFLKSYFLSKQIDINRLKV